MGRIAAIDIDSLWIVTIFPAGGWVKDTRLSVRGRFLGGPFAGLGLSCPLPLGRYLPVGPRARGGAEAVVRKDDDVVVGGPLVGLWSLSSSTF